MGNLNGKVVWLTGASSGIGEALAYVLTKEGAKLVLSARREDELKRVKNDLVKNYAIAESDIFILPLDLVDINSFSDKRNQVFHQFGQIDVLINNGGISQRSLAKETSIEVDRKLFKVNFFGTVALTKIVLVDMLRQKSGHLVSVTSAVGKFGSPWRSGYSASKHALHGFFDSLRAEVFADNVNVLLVCPGFIQTNVSRNALTGTGVQLGTMDEATAKGLTAAECAEGIVKAIKSGKEEVVIGGFKENLGIWMKRFFPSVFSIMVRKMAVR